MLPKSRNSISRRLFRNHTAIILPILLLYIYLLFFAGKYGPENLKSRNKQYFDIPVEQRADWQNVHHPKYNFSVYSAFSVDTYPGSSAPVSPEVHVITAYRTFENEEQPVKCRFYFDDDDNHKEELSVATPAHIEAIPGWDFRFAGNFVKCPIPTETDDINNIRDHPMKKPSTVSILVGNQTQSDNRVTINYQTTTKSLKKESSYDFQLSLCSLPVHEYNQVFHFLEWFEFHRMMGIQQFTFYNMSIGPELSCVMKTLQKDAFFPGITVNINPWQQYPIQNFSIQSFGHGLSAATNDCLLRHKGKSKYLVMAMEFDEFIMPRIEETGLRNFKDLLNFLDTQNETAKYGEYLFKNGYFERNRARDINLGQRCGHLRNNAFEYHVCQELFVMQFVKREEFQYWTRDNGRAKYIVRPERVKVAGHHGAIKLEEGFESKRVSEHVAFSRHYRYFNEGESVKVEKVPIEFGVKLARNVGQSMEYLMDKCGLSFGDIFKE